MCLWCGAYIITEGAVGDTKMKMCAYKDSHIRLNAERIPEGECGVCNDDDSICYNLHIIPGVGKQSGFYRELIREMSKIWVCICYDLLFQSKSYINKLYFRSEFTRRLRQHYGYNIKIALHRAPIAEVVTFIRCIQHYNSIALADALEGVFEKVFIDVMTDERTFPYPQDDEEHGMTLHSTSNGRWMGITKCIPKW